MGGPPARWLDNLTGMAQVLAVELLVAWICGAAAAVAATRAVRDLRPEVDGPGPDRFVAPDLAAAEHLIRSGAAVSAAERVAGALR